jgi:FkbM family methyltransferase
MLTVKFNGQTCYFDSEGVDLDRPGIIDACLIRGEFYEQRFLRYIASLEICGAYVDVGACVGTHSTFFAMCCPADHVYAFEPRARQRARLEGTLELNDLHDKVTVFSSALSDAHGEVTVRLDGREHTLPTRRLDRLVRGPVALIKIDVEGMEPQVLAGATNLLRRYRPRVFVEAQTNEDVERVQECLRPYGYRATGRVFNASPTYEFVPSFALWTRMTQCSKRLALRSLRRILPGRVRGLIRRAAALRGAARRAAAGTGPCADRRSQGRAADR